MKTPTNERSALDARTALCLHIEDHWPGASEFCRWMNIRLVVIVLILGGLPACSSHRAQWTPGAAVADAQHDIASGHIRFAYVGGFVPFAPGVPEDSHGRLQRYGRLKVGPQGCVQDKRAEEREDYARVYNQIMWTYVSTQR